jgi:hypothetical protein
MPELVVSLMAWVALLTGSPRLETVPTVVRLPHAELEAVACGHPCPVLGLYTYGDVVLLDDALDVEADLYARSVLLHELVHYAQEMGGKYAGMETCMAAILREREAYHVQNEYLRRHGAVGSAGSSLHTLRCVTAAAVR